MIFFDLDGTLLDHDHSERLGAAALFRRFSPPGTEEDFVRRWADCLERNYPRYLSGEMTLTECRRLRTREVLDATLSDADADHAYAYYLQSYAAAWKAFDDVAPTFARLSGRLGVITNGQGDQQRGKVAFLGLKERFEVVIASSEAPAAKPDARIFLAACKAASIDPREATYVGDRLDVDARGAAAIGMKGVWLNRKRDASAADVRVIHSLKELL